MTANSHPSSSITQARHDSPVFSTPFGFQTILEDQFSPGDLVAAEPVTRERYLVSAEPGAYLAIGNAGKVEVSGTLSTYQDTMVKIFQAVFEPGTGRGFRLDSELHALWSLDIEAGSTRLAFHSNWGAATGSGGGYLTFRYDAATKRLQVIGRFRYDPKTLTHSPDPSFTSAGWYVRSENGGFTLVAQADAASPITFYRSPIDVSMPQDFNPDGIPYQPNARVSAREYVGKNRDDVESLNGNFHRNLAAAYQSQVAAVGNDPGTAQAAERALDQIETTLASEGARLRYPKPLYRAFRTGALSTVLGSDDIANGSLGMHTVPYVYFTNAADAQGVHHPFMVIASYAVADKPNRLLDVSRPPGDGLEGGYAEQMVTRDATIQFYLTKIPLRDYGLVQVMTDNKLPRTLRSDEHAPAPDTVYNYASTSAVGLAVDGVVIYPPLNNTLGSAQENAEITSTGIHVGRGMGLHYHADGHTASPNDFNLYNGNDYLGQKHPPLIGFGLDGVALFGTYESAYPGMDGSTVPLDEYGGHTHDALGYHYHSHLVKAKSSKGVPYILHVLMTGAWKGNIGAIPNFWDDQKGEPAYSLSQRHRYVGEDESAAPPPPPRK